MYEPTQYEWGKYVKNKDTGELGNRYDDMQAELHAGYRLALTEWKKELIGDRAFIHICNEKIDELEARDREHGAQLDKLYRRYIDAEGESRIWWMWAIENEQSRQKNNKKKLTGWLIKKDIAKGKREEKYLDIGRAKSVPIADILGQEQRTHNGRQFFKCVAHNEKTASMCWYVKENKVKCFGCNFRGDPIDLFQKLYNCDFKSAVEALNKF